MKMYNYILPVNESITKEVAINRIIKAYPMLKGIQFNAYPIPNEKEWGAIVHYADNKLPDLSTYKIYESEDFNGLYIIRLP